MDVVGRALLILVLGVSIFGSIAALASVRSGGPAGLLPARSEEHTSELQSL